MSTIRFPFLNVHYTQESDMTDEVHDIMDDGFERDALTVIDNYIGHSDEYMNGQETVELLETTAAQAEGTASQATAVSAEAISFTLKAIMSREGITVTRANFESLRGDVNPKEVHREVARMARGAARKLSVNLENFEHNLLDAAKDLFRTRAMMLHKLDTQIKASMEYLNTLHDDTQITLDPGDHNLNYEGKPVEDLVHEVNTELVMFANLHSQWSKEYQHFMNKVTGNKDHIEREVFIEMNNPTNVLSGIIGHERRPLLVGRYIELKRIDGLKTQPSGNFASLVYPSLETALLVNALPIKSKTRKGYASNARSSSQGVVVHVNKLKGLVSTLDLYVARLSNDYQRHNFKEAEDILRAEVGGSLPKDIYALVKKIILIDKNVGEVCFKQTYTLAMAVIKLARSMK